MAFYYLEGFENEADLRNALLCSLIVGIMSGRMPELEKFMIHKPPPQPMHWKEVAAKFKELAALDKKKKPQAIKGQRI